MFVILSCCNSKMCVQGQSLHVLVGRTRFKVPRQPGFNAGPGSLMARKASRDLVHPLSRQFRQKSVLLCSTILARLFGACEDGVETEWADLPPSNAPGH
jgi:hypothetical protein